MDSHILKSMKRLFLNKNKDILSSRSEEAFNNCSSSSTVHEFIKAHFPFTGYSTIEDYYSNNNPVDWIPKVRDKLRILNQKLNY